MKLLLLSLIVLTVTVCNAQSTAPKIGQTETSVINAYKKTKSKKLAAMPNQTKLKDRVLRYQNKGYSDVYYIDTKTNKVDIQHIVFDNEEDARKFEDKLNSSAIRKPSPHLWHIKSGSQTFIAFRTQVLVGKETKEAVVYMLK